MSTQNRNQLDALLAQIQEMWALQDRLFASLNETNGWGQKHGPHWTFADVPYHLAYCNREVVVRGFKLAMGKPEPIPGGDPDTGRFDILHSARLVLLDGSGRIHGYYDADQDGLSHLRGDIERLVARSRTGSADSAGTGQR